MLTDLTASPIIGDWRWVLRRTGCVEGRTFRADGAFLVTSADEVITGRYAIGGQANRNGRLRLITHAESDNRQPDCGGRTSASTGKTYTDWLSFSDAFSIWNADAGAQVYDSGSELEVRTAAVFPANFNSTNDENNFDNRSDNKGPEPESVAIGSIDGRSYAFVVLERIGGVMAYDVTDPSAPSFAQYLTNRDFDADPVGPDSGPEVVRFVESSDSPTGAPLVVISNEISGTVSLWKVNAITGQARLPVLNSPLPGLPYRHPPADGKIADGWTGQAPSRRSGWPCGCWPG